MKQSCLTLLCFVAGAGCGPGPDPTCAPMCTEAAAAYGACLTEAPGSSPAWVDAGYNDEQGFLDACDTWAWEQRLLARAAEGRRRGDAQVDAACAEREAALRAAADPCAAFFAEDWSAPLP